MTERGAIVQVLQALEETWACGDSEHDCDVVYLDNTAIAQFWRGPECDRSGSARLAACAPEAFRLLFEAEWWGPGGVECQWCEGFVQEGHRADCKWLALMKKSGLR